MLDSVIWCIGAIDCSGGAGLAADARAANSLGVEACLVTTAISVQNHTQCVNVTATSLSVLQQTMTLLSQQRLPDAIKIGVVIDDHQARLISHYISVVKEQAPHITVVWDPVFRSSSEGELSQLSSDGIRRLATVTDLITPNIDELRFLSGTEIINDDSALNAAQLLLRKKVKGVLVKAGHASWQSQPADICVLANQGFQMQYSRHNNTAVRGTGCTLASAIASACALGYELKDAICLAGSYLHQARNHTLSVTQTHRVFSQAPWPNNSAHCPRVNPLHRSRPLLNKGFKPLTNEQIGLYPVVDSVAWLKTLLPTGIRMIQLRVKSDDPAFLRDAIGKAIELCRDTHCQLFINDHWELAIELGAYGVHLGQEDLDTANLAAIQQAGLRLGISTHGYYEICTALSLQPSYIALGHIFPTETKVMPSSPQGLERLKQYADLLSSTPTVAIGGIGLDKAEAVAACGVNGVAVVTAITKAADPIEQTLALQRKVGHA